MRFTYLFRSRSEKGRNRVLILFYILALLLMATSCKKDKNKMYPATLQVFNAMDENTSLYTYLSNNRPEQFRTSLEIRSKLYDQRNNLLYVNNFPQHIDFYAKPDTMPHHRPALSMVADLKEGAIYSLFIYGTKSTAAFTLLQDRIPAINSKDSTTHIRIANFSESQSISVNIQGQPAGSLAANIPFKSLSDFIELDASKTVNGYVFEIRNQATDELLSSYTTANFHTSDLGVTKWLSKSNTLVFTGNHGAASPDNQKITLMNHR